MTPKRKEKLWQVLMKRQNNLTVVLENVFDPHNEAAVMRTCDSVGIQDIYIINNRERPKKQWGFKSGSSAKKWLTIHTFTEVVKCITEVRKNYKNILATRLAPSSKDLYEIDFTQSTALVFGNERFGVSDEMAALANGNFIIPQTGIISSLNISVACAVTLYEAYRQKELAGHYKNAALPAERMTEIITHWGVKEEEIFTP